MLSSTEFTAGFEIQMIPRQILFTLIDYEIVSAPTSAMIYIVSSLFLFWFLHCFCFGFSSRMEDFIYLFIFSSQLTLKVLAGSKPRNKTYNHKVRNPSWIMVSCPHFCKHIPSCWFFSLSTPLPHFRGNSEKSTKGSQQLKLPYFSSAGKQQLKAEIWFVKTA